MNARKKVLGPPKGAEQTAQAARDVLGSRLRDDSDMGTSVNEPTHTQVYSSHTSVTPVPDAAPKRRREPAGKTRKTYYLAADTVRALDDSVERIRSALGGRVDRHEAIGAIITAGAAQTDQIIAALRADLMRELAPDEGVQ